MKRSGGLFLILVLCACSSLMIYTPPSYRISEDNAREIKRFGGQDISVGPFKKAVVLDNDCGITAGSIKMPNNMGFEDYIRQALVTELENADMLNDERPKIILTGTVEQLAFSSRRNIYTSTWTIGLRIDSSNGQSVTVTDHYDFDAGAGSSADCQKIADAYMPAVQKILYKFIDAPEYKSLIMPVTEPAAQ